MRSLDFAGSFDLIRCEALSASSVLKPGCATGAGCFGLTDTSR